MADEQRREETRAGRPTVEAERIALKATIKNVRASGPQFVGWAVAAYRENGALECTWGSRIFTGIEANLALREARKQMPRFTWRRVRVEVSL